MKSFLTICNITFSQKILQSFCLIFLSMTPLIMWLRINRKFLVLSQLNLAITWLIIHLLTCILKITILFKNRNNYFDRLNYNSALIMPLFSSILHAQMIISRRLNRLHKCQRLYVIVSSRIEKNDGLISSLTPQLWFMTPRWSHIIICNIQH